MISLQSILLEHSIIPEDEIKERSWVAVFRYHPHLEVLLVQDEDGKWSMPGGQLDDEETPEEAARRELKEETKLIPSELHFLKTIYHDKPHKLKVSHVFYTEVPVKSAVKPNEDAEKAKWFSLDKLPEMNDLSHPKREAIDVAAEKIYDAKKELKEAIDMAKELDLPIPQQLLTEGKRKRTVNGYLIVFEGIDGSGKTTQRKALQKWLENREWKVVSSKWGTSPRISEIIKTGKEQKWLTPTLYSLLNASDMVWRYENEIKPALERGAIVLCDRYYYTSYARDQLRGVNKKLLDSIYESFVEPDLVIHFKVSPRLAMERLMNDKGFGWYSSGMDIGYHKNMEECALIYETNMDKVYDEVLKKAKNYRHVNSERSIDEIFKEIKHFIYERVKAVKRVPPKAPISEALSFKKVMREVLTERYSFKQLLAGSEPGRIERGKRDVRTRPMRVTTMDGNEAWTFRYKSYPSTTGNPWHGYIQFFKEDVSEKESTEDLDCMVDCDCPDYRYRYAYNNAQAGAGRIGRHPEWRYGNENTGRPPRPRSEGGVGDYGIGLCKHLCSLGEYLKTNIDAPEPEDKPPLSRTVEPAPRVTPETPTTTDAPEPEDSYTDSRSGLQEGLQKQKSHLYERMEKFVKENPQFVVMYNE
jgi:dTMP kinase